MGTEVVPRPTARVLITNDDGRLLLFHCRMSLDHPDDLCWITLGGGVRAGETLAAAAVRELREETGIVVTLDQLGGVIAYATGKWSASDTIFAA